MKNLNKETIESLNSVLDQVAHNITRRIVGDKITYSSYAGLNYDQVFPRIYPALKAVLASVEAGNSNPLLGMLDAVFEARLRTGYEPNVLLRVIDLVAEQLVEAVLATRPNDPLFASTVRRRIYMLNNQSKLHLANLNLMIPIAERTEIDPDLLRQKELAS